MEARRLLLVVGIALAAAGCAAAPQGRGIGPPRADAVGLVAIHSAGTPHFDKACLNCHGDIMKRTTLNPKFKEAHAAMIPFMPDYDSKVGVTSENCLSCHYKVDVIQHSAMYIRKNSEVTACEGCHSTTGMSKKKFYAN
jgi:hypothetical protein